MVTSSAAAARVADAAAALRERMPMTPRLALILGSGWAGVADAIEAAGVASFTAVPGLAGPRPAGHPGRVVWGRLEGVACVVFVGRRHLYDGATAADAALPARLAARLGAQILLVTNAAGAIRRTLEPGDVMIIDDHLNLQWRNPLTGAPLAGEPRFPDMCRPYDPELQMLAERVAIDLGLRVRRGVYAAVLGPSYETRAEVRMLERFGADAVGMSTVPEALAGVAAGLRVLGLSFISNVAAGLRPTPLSHDEVLGAGAAAAAAFTRLLRGFVAALPDESRQHA